MVQEATKTLWPTTATTTDDATTASVWFQQPQMDVASCTPEESVGAYDRLQTYGITPQRQEKIDTRYFKMPAAERNERIFALQRQLGSRLTILGHHYQRDEVVQFANFQGDSYKLSQMAAEQRDADFTLFCGVHFMAESADILGADHQKVILPNMEAGCSMADMAKPEDVEVAWNTLHSLGAGNIVPITYMNSAASIKAFCGKNGGIVCTSSNATRVYDWAFARGERIMFFPDEHLGRNTAIKRGISEDEMVVWDPFLPLGGNTEDQLRNARVILWKGYCSVHARFSVEQIQKAREEYPDVNVLVHPECRAEVVAQSDFDGSTEYICEMVRNAESGSVWAVGTEINLVRRLQSQMPDKTIFCLDPVICPCSTMYRIHPAYMLWALEHLVEGRVVNQVIVDADVKHHAKVALDRMLSVP